jgi:PPE-repeat protein
LGNTGSLDFGNNGSNNIGLPNTDIGIGRGGNGEIGINFNSSIGNIGFGNSGNNNIGFFNSGNGNFGTGPQATATADTGTRATQTRASGIRATPTRASGAQVPETSVFSPREARIQAACTPGFIRVLEIRVLQLG